MTALLTLAASIIAATGWGGPAPGLRAACANEIGLLCREDADDEAVKRCLRENIHALLPACKARMGGRVRRKRKSSAWDAPSQVPAPAPEQPAMTPRSPILALAAPEPGIALNVIHETYAITGSNQQELERQMESLGPIDTASGIRFPGRTSHTLVWRFNTSRVDGLCAVVSATISLNITIMLPSWEGAVTAPEPLASGWARFFAGLRAHEDGHRNIVIRGAGDVLRAVRSAPPQASCEDLKRAANATGQDALAKVTAENVAYDRDTDHGRRP